MNELNSIESRVPISVFGAGSWGTTLAVLLARNGLPVTLWGRDPETMAHCAKSRSNARFLPGITFPEGLRVTSDLAEAAKSARVCLIVVPSQAFRAMLLSLAPILTPGVGVAWATKGLEPGSGKLLHVIAREVLGGAYPLAVVSGPSFAQEVAQGLPTALTVASPSPEFAEQLAAALHSDSLRTYTSEDIVGVELGGAIKNVLAIAAGIADGLAFGANTRAALITRGLAEMMRLGETLGGKRETFFGLAGLGDLVLSCTDNQSRNYCLGVALARGVPLQEALSGANRVVEGVPTVGEVVNLARSLGVEMPIAEQVYSVIQGERSAFEAAQVLLERSRKRGLQDQNSGS